MKKYLVVKYIQPSGLYKEGLAPLAHEDEREILIREPGLVIERWSFDEGEAKEVASRIHVREVFEEGYATTKNAECGDELSFRARQLSIDEAAALHNAPGAWAKGYKGQGMRMAVLDTGCDPALAESLGSRLVAKESFVEGEDWRDQSGDSHGSFCLEAVAKTCPEAEVVSIKVLSSKDGSGYSSWIIKGIKRAVELGCTSIGMSLGGPGNPKDAMSLTVDWADGQGVLVPCAAGNEQRGTTEYMADKSHPACADKAISCAAVDSDYAIAPFSNWGTTVDTAAVGVRIFQAGRAWSGTSMSTPFVHGVAGLVGSAAKKHGLSPKEAKAALYAGARDTALPIHQEGHGVVDAVSALSKLSIPTPPPAPTPPKPEGYFPHLKRMPITRYLMGGYREECVVTKSGKDVAHSTPKG